MIKPTEEKKIFVYGSLREGFFNYEKYLSGKVSKAVSGCISGKLYHLTNKGYPAVLDGNDTIYGEIMEMNNFFEDIIPMDKMEGYLSFEDTSKNEYTRMSAKVKNMETMEYEDCYIYKYELSHTDDFKSNSEYIPHGNWAEYMNSKNRI